MSAQTVYAKMTTAFICKECKREWVKLDGDIIAPPEPCPFCKIGRLRSDLADWLSLARRQYSEMNHNDGICPTLKGINKTEKLLNVELTVERDQEIDPSQ